MGTFWVLGGNVSRRPKSKKFETNKIQLWNHPQKKNQNRPYTLNPKPKVLIKVELETVGQ